MHWSLGVTRVALDMHVVGSSVFVLDPFDCLFRRRNFRIAYVAQLFARKQWGHRLLFLGVVWQLLLQFITKQRWWFLMALLQLLGNELGWRTLSIQLVCYKIWQEIPSSWFLSDGGRRIAHISRQIIRAVLVGIELVFLISVWRVEVLLAQTRR